MEKDKRNLVKTGDRLWAIGKEKAGFRIKGVRINIAGRAGKEVRS